MTFLPDVNVWIALAVIEHEHHARAIGWFGSTAGHRMAFSRVTQMGFLRLLTNQHVMKGDQLTPEAAWHRLDEVRRVIAPLFISEPENLEKEWRAGTSSAKGGTNVWTDAYLTALALATGCTFVTFDHGVWRPRKLSIVIL